MCMSTHMYHLEFTMKNTLPYSLLTFSLLLMAPAAETDHSAHCSSCEPGHAHESHDSPSSSSTIPGRLRIVPTLVLDTFGYYQDSGKDAVELSELAGFGHGHEDEDHDHTTAENGLNLRHIELSFYAKLD